MRRREFITLIGGAAGAIPMTSRAQRSAVVGVLNPEGPRTGNVNGLVQGLRELGYVEGRNIRFEYRWGRGKIRPPVRTGGRFGSLEDRSRARLVGC
jgi:putative tryptophan/tyrosine transport system substrate-binding protein